MILIYSYENKYLECQCQTDGFPGLELEGIRDYVKTTRLMRSKPVGDLVGELPQAINYDGMHFPLIPLYDGQTKGKNKRPIIDYLRERLIASTDPALATIIVEFASGTYICRNAPLALTNENICDIL